MHFGHHLINQSHFSGTRVMRVMATDLDGNDGPAGKLNYSIVSQHEKFAIDSQTGWLTTNAVSHYIINCMLESDSTFCEKSKEVGYNCLWLPLLCDVNIYGPIYLQFIVKCTHEIFCIDLIFKSNGCYFTLYINKPEMLFRPKTRDIKVSESIKITRNEKATYRNARVLAFKNIKP